MAKRRLNGSGREIWFERVLWSYMPCHWKGVAVMAVVIVPTITCVFLGQWIIGAIGVQDAEQWPFVLIFPGVITGLIIANRHS
jgi:hypothetical protein